jgi:dihydropteroate synthase
MGVSPRAHYSLNLKSGTLNLGSRTLIMGVLNVTPDSFSDAGKFFDFSVAVRQAMDMIAAGADILDVGGESTRPDSDPISVEMELERVIPVIEAIRSSSGIPISIDTTKSEVAREALAAGADIINDVSALRFDDRMVDLVAETAVPLILMHMLGTPKTMQKHPSYSSLFSQIIAFLEERLQFASSRGVAREQIMVDPGIGFGKTVEHNLAIIRNLEAFQCLDRPILLGASRKRFIGSVLDRPVEDREVGTAVALSFGIAAGAHIARVHDVPFHRQVTAMADALRGSS